MATTKVQGIYRTQRRVNPKTGKVYKTKIKVGDKYTNTTKGSNLGLKGNKAILESQRISEAANVQKAKIAGRTTQISEAIAGATSTAMKALEKGRQSSEIRNMKESNAAVAQAINGGAQQAQTSRNDDEDEEDNPYIN